MSKKLKSFILKQFKASPSLVKKFGDQIDQEAEKYYNTLIADEDGDVDPTDLITSFTETHKPFLHKQFDGHFKGQYTNILGRDLVSKLAIPADDVKDENGNIAFDKVIAALEAKVKANAGEGGKGNEELEGLKKTIQTMQDEHKKLIDAEKQRAEAAEKAKQDYIDNDLVTKFLVESTQKAYEKQQLREGLSLDQIAKGYKLQADNAGIVFRVVDGKVGAYKKDSPNELFLEGANTLDVTKNIRTQMDTLYNPIKIAGKSFDQKEFDDKGDPGQKPNEIEAALEGLLQ